MAENMWVSLGLKNPTYREYNSIYNDRLGGLPFFSFYVHSTNG